MTTTLVSPHTETVTQLVKNQTIESLQRMRDEMISSFDASDKHAEFKMKRLPQCICNIETAIAILEGKKFAVVTQAIIFRPANAYRIDAINGYFDIQHEILSQLKHGEKDGHIHDAMNLYQGLIKLPIIEVETDTVDADTDDSGFWFTYTDNDGIEHKEYGDDCDVMELTAQGYTVTLL